MSSLDVLAVALRALTYVGSIAAAGGVLFALSFPHANAAVRSDIRRQVIFGCCLLLVVVPLRYLVFQLSIAGGDWQAAFGPDLRWMAFETPMGPAALTRLVAAGIMLGVGYRSFIAAVVAGLAMIASFAMEGHTASSEARSVLGTTALLIHVTAVHWWIGALYPLLILTRSNDPMLLSNAVESFSRKAVWIVAALLAAGVLVLAILIGGQLDLERAYQQRFLLKIALVVGLLSIAAWNKLRLTPLLRRDHEAGRTRLGRSIKVEGLVALSILLATSWATNSAPEG